MSMSFKTYLSENNYSNIKTRLELHSKLNDKLWIGKILRSDVAEALQKITKEFIEFLGIPENTVLDIILTGSNCSLNYTSMSDIDVHLVIDETKVCDHCDGDFITDCFKAKKDLWNSEHDITVKGYPVELYAQSKKDHLVASGIYSLKKEKWLKYPSEIGKTRIDDTPVKLKAGEIMDKIDSAISDKITNMDTLLAIKTKIKKMRQSGLEENSEYSVENLTFKVLRNNGYFDKLDNYMKKLEDANLSLN